MKKTLSLFLIILLVGLFVLPKLSFANVVLTVDEHILPTAATLISAGLTPNQEVVFKIIGIENSILTTSNSSGLATADFSNLSPNHQYTGNVFYKSNLSLVLAQVTFSTPASLDVTDIGSRFATITATGLTSNNGAGYYLSAKRNDGTEDYHLTIYLETGDDGKPQLASPLIPSTDYTVSLTNKSNNIIVAHASFTTLAGKSSAKDITSFNFNGLSPAVVGVISGQNISLSVPTGTNITALVPTIAVSSKATVSPASGVAKNFTNPVTYTVTAEDASTQAYTATVSIENSNPCLLYTSPSPRDS